MPARPVDTGWDFGPVLNLISSDVREASPASLSRSQTTASSRLETDQKYAATGGGVHLGSFGHVFAGLGIPYTEPVYPISPVEPTCEETSESDDAVFTQEEDGGDPIVVGSVAAQELSANEDINSKIKKPMISKEYRNVSPASLTGQKLEHADKTTSSGKCAMSLVKDLISPASTTRANRLKIVKHNSSNALSTPPSLATPAIMSTTTLTESERKKLRAILDMSLVKVTAPVAMPDTDAATRSEKTPKIKERIKLCPEKRLLRNVRNKIMRFQAERVPQEEYTDIIPSAKDARSFSKNLLNPMPSNEDGKIGISTRYQVISEQERVVAADPGTGPITPPHPPKAPSTGHSSPYVASGHQHGLIPRTVQPVIVPRLAQLSTKPESARPLVTIPYVATVSAACPSPQPISQPLGQSGFSTQMKWQTEINICFLNLLATNFPEDLPWLVSPMRLCNPATSADGIHVFVDASNIMIGFKHALLNLNAPGFDLSFSALALLLERRRPVTKRVFAGSRRQANPYPDETRLIQSAKAVGYEDYVTERVFIERPMSEKTKFFNDVKRMGHYQAMLNHRICQGNDSDTMAPAGEPTEPVSYNPRWVEQGVDEILHLKMCQSIIDTEQPSTMVLATGDGAAAEMSDGFLAQVERALYKGWKVELVSWSHKINKGYRRDSFRERWKDQFRIIILNDFVECLIDST